MEGAEQQQQLMARVQELEREKRSLQNGNQKLRGKIKELRGENKELRGENREYKKHSIEASYGTCNGDFKLPKFRINRGVKPHVTGKYIKEVKIKQDYVESDDFVGMSVPIHQIKIPVKNQTSGAAIISTLASIAGDAKLGLEYVNEAQVQDLCFNMIRDALRCLGMTSDIVMPHTEVSIYTMRPDILVVLRCHGCIVFVVEVKSPELEPDQVFASEKVAGQMWSYLLALRAMGDKNPMGAIMTYNKIVLATLDNYSQKNKNDVEEFKPSPEDVESFQQAVAKAKEILSTGVLRTETNTAKEKPCYQRDETLMKSVYIYSKQNQRADSLKQDLNNNENEDKDIPGEIYYSKLRKDGEVFPCLLQAIQIALLKGDGAKEAIPVLEQGMPLGNRLAFVTTTDGSFKWVQTKKELRANVTKKIPQPTAANFYILGKLGEGSKAAVYLVCSTEGAVCAMKSYYYDSKDGNDNNDDDDNDTKKAAEKLRDHEHKLWERLYRDRKLESRALSLGPSPCLLMSYGRQLCDWKEGEGKEEAARNQARVESIPGIKTELARFARKGYKYQNSDLRWRHVLHDIDDKIFLCDLESLEELEGEENKEDVVWDQLRILVQTLDSNHLDLDQNLNWLRNKTNYHVVESFLSGKHGLRDLVAEGQKILEHTLGSLFPHGSEIDSLSPKAAVCLRIISFWKMKEKYGSKVAPPTSPIEAPSLSSDSPGSDVVGVSGNSEREPKRRKTDS